MINILFRIESFLSKYFIDVGRNKKKKNVRKEVIISLFLKYIM